MSGVAVRPGGFFGRLGPGSRIGGYLIEEIIGAGGMAMVFRAKDEALGRFVALKVIAPALADDEEFRTRFLRESRAVAGVDSPFIIPVYAAGEADDGLLYIATRFVTGGDLATQLRRAGGRLEPERVSALVLQVGSALDAAHAAGLVHRDVKPGNILVDTAPYGAGHAYLADFGLSKGTQSASGLTDTGQFVGTADYCAPEQIRGDFVDGRTDQYALGCVAFALLAGSPPFRRPDTVGTLFAHMQEPVPEIAGLRPELPTEVHGVIARAMAKSARERYPSCSDFGAALRVALAAPVHGPVPVLTAGTPQQEELPAALGRSEDAITVAVPARAERQRQAGAAVQATSAVKPRPAGRLKRTWWLVAAIALCAAIGVPLALLGVHRHHEVSVPQVRGLPWATAAAQIKAAGLVPVEHKQMTSAMSAGLVISTAPDRGSMPEDGVVTVEVSTQLVTSLPDMRGSQVNAAVAQLKSLGFKNVTQVADSRSTAAAGQVSGMTPAPGTYPSNQSIVLDVSAGNVKVPSVVKKTQSSAVATLQKSGFLVYTVVEADQSDGSINPGTVYRESPAAGSVEPKNTVIKIYVQPYPPAPAPTPTSSPTSNNSGNGGGGFLPI